MNWFGAKQVIDEMLDPLRWMEFSCDDTQSPAVFTDLRP